MVKNMDTIVQLAKHRGFVFPGSDIYGGLSNTWDYGPLGVELKNKTDILDLVSEYVKLEKRGRNYIGLCPFHDEKTPSFTVSEDKQICHCFGCKKGGNVFQFTQEIKDVSFVEAVKDLGERVNIQVDIGQNQTNSSTKIASDELKMIEMHELIKDYYHYALMET